MSNVCQSIFGSYAEPEDTEICKAWFRTAIDHCSSQFQLPSQPVWLFKKLWLFSNRIFGKPNFFSIASRHIPKNPTFLSNNDCSELYASMARDYIDVVPHLNTCRQEHIFSTHLLWSILMIISIIIVFFVWTWKLVWERKPKADMNRRNLNQSAGKTETRVNPNVTLQRHLYEVRRLVVPKNCFLDIMDGPSMVTFEHQSKSKVCSVIARLIKKSSLNETADTLHSNGRRCRIVFDFVYYHSDSDESDGGESKATQELSREKTYIVEKSTTSRGEQTKGDVNVKDRYQNRTDLLSESSTTSTINCNAVINKQQPLRRRGKLSDRSTRIPKLSN